MTEPMSFPKAPSVGFATLAVTLLLAMPEAIWAQRSNAAFLDRYCAACHNERLKSGGLSLAQVDLSRPGAQSELWEKVARKLRTGVMPPPNVLQPFEVERREILTWLETSLDAASAAKLNPGRTETLRRLNRTEYQNAIRDLLALDIDAAALLPADESGHGFDNVNVGDLSATLLNRYISAAQKISRLAVGSTQSSLQSDTISLPADLTQEDQLPGLPIGTRGGLSTSYTFAQDGEYEIQISLMRDLAGVVSGLREARSHEMLVLVDREPVQTFTISKATIGDEILNEKALKSRITVKAGPHNIAVTFLKEGSSLIETPRQPTQSRFNDRRHPRTAPAIDKISVTGPYSAKGSGETPSRRRLFVCRPIGQDKVEEEKCAGAILSLLTRRAYRRPIGKSDIDKPMAFYRKGRAEGDFDAGITAALAAVLTNPEFLFRVESDPKKVGENGVYRVGDLEFASRLSFFLWSSIPDDELRDLAAAGRLEDPAVLEAQVRRMLRHPRASALVDNFASQWLSLRGLQSSGPNPDLFPEFDENLRDAFRRETELFVGSQLQEDRSLADLLSADYTFVNERLARHYGIPNVYGSHFRRVRLTDPARFGLLGKGSMLTVTSYGNRTSPVLRGHWLLDNVLGTPPPPPPANVPGLADKGEDGRPRSVRERMEQHRKDPQCASCHVAMDPLGFALENFDAVGKWRAMTEAGTPVDPDGALPDGTPIAGVAGLRTHLLNHREQFVGTVADKLLTYAIGRGTEYFDRPALRRLTREAVRGSPAPHSTTAPRCDTRTLCCSGDHRTGRRQVSECARVSPPSLKS